MKATDAEFERVIVPLVAAIEAELPGMTLRVVMELSESSLNAMVPDPMGSGTGVHLSWGDPFEEQLMSLADQVQEVVIEALPAMGSPTNWPICPEHPSTHPMRAGLRDGHAMWCCPTTETAHRSVLP